MLQIKLNPFVIKLSFSMAKRRVKRTVKQSTSSPSSNIENAGPNEPPIEKKEDHEIERQIAVSRAIRDVETDQLLTGLHLLRSYFKKEQLQTPVLQFFKENLPNLSIVKNGKDGQYAVQWRDKEGNLSMNQAGRDLHKPLLHRMSIAYPDCSTAMQSFGGIEFSRKAVKASLLGADNLQISDFVLEELSDTQMLGLQDGLQTPGASSHGGLSVGMTPKTLRLPKHGEMLLSVHGSPLGVYKEDMEAIHETEEG